MPLLPATVGYVVGFFSAGLADYNVAVGPLALMMVHTLLTGLLSAGLLPITFPSSVIKWLYTLSDVSAGYVRLVSHR